MSEELDQGAPIAYGALEDGVAVFAAGGERIGRVASVLAAEEKDVFHGLLIDTDAGLRFAEAALVASIHERRVDLSIDAAAAAALPEPEHGAPVFGGDATRQQGWRHWLHRLSGRSDWDRRS